MKKSLALVLTLCMLVFMVAVTGCDSAATEDESGITQMGLGIVTDIGKSRDAAEGVNAQAQVDTTVAAVAFDKDGVIVDVRIDVAQVRVAYDEDMKVTTDKEAAIRTKKELGPAYNMLPRSDIGKEWNEQMAAFEEWMIGKTVEEVQALKVKVVDAAHQHVPDVPELTSSVTITVESYIAAVAKAWENVIDVEGIATMGLGVVIGIDKSRDASDSATAQAQADVTLSATGFDQANKVVATIIDVAQTRVLFDADGKVASDKTATLKTKKELGDDYNMLPRSDIGKEWYEQMDAFEEWMMGKSMAEIISLNVKVVDAAHQHVPDVPELTSSVTITVESYLEAVSKSFRSKK